LGKEVGRAAISCNERTAKKLKTEISLQGQESKKRGKMGIGLSKKTFTKRTRIKKGKKLKAWGKTLKDGEQTTNSRRNPQGDGKKGARVANRKNAAQKKVCHLKKKPRSTRASPRKARRGKKRTTSS